MTGRSLRIGLLGQCGIGNLGNEGSMEAMVGFLRERAPEAKLTCICVNPEIVHRELGIEAMRLQAPPPKSASGRVLNRALFKMPGRIANIAYTLANASRLDLLIVPGTGILEEYNKTPLAMPYHLWRWCHAARLSGVKIAFVSVGAGPIVHWLSRFLLKGATLCADTRSYRDQHSKAFLASIGVRTAQDLVTPDLVFSLRPGFTPSPRAGDGPLMVAIGVMAMQDWSGVNPATYQSYLGKLSDYIVWLLQAGRRIRFVITKDHDATAVEDVSSRVLERAPALAGGIEPFEPARNLHHVTRQMEQSDIAVVSRFHKLVCALRAGRPAISIGYGPKNHALMVEMGLGAFSQKVEHFDLDQLKAQTEQLIAQRAVHEASIRRKVADYEVQLRAQEQFLMEQVLCLSPRNARS